MAMLTNMSFTPNGEQCTVKLLTSLAIQRYAGRHQAMRLSSSGRPYLNPRRRMHFQDACLEPSPPPSAVAPSLARGCDPWGGGEPPYPPPASPSPLGGEGDGPGGGGGGGVGCRAIEDAGRVSEYVTGRMGGAGAGACPPGVVT